MIRAMPSLTAHAQQFGLLRDMLAAPEVVRRFDPRIVDPLAGDVAAAGRLLLTGEGSSRIFPARNAQQHSARRGDRLQIAVEAGRQAQELPLDGWAVLAASNSGRTAEVVQLFNALAAAGHPRRYSLAAHPQSKLESLAVQGFVLGCGAESAVAATKSVVEQALFEVALVDAAAGRRLEPSLLARLADDFEAALTADVDPALVERIARSSVCYWAGRNNGVAEELALKTNEIARKPSDFLDGTYAVHGIEEVMNREDVVLWIDPYPQFEQKFHDVLVKGVGLEIIAIASRSTLFPTVRIPEGGPLAPFVQLAAGWSLLARAGLAMGIDLDKPQRARKVGNEFVG